MSTTGVSCVLSASNDPLAALSAKPALCRTCRGQRIHNPTRRLITKTEVEVYLTLTPENVQSLINTRQLTVIRIKGEERFDLRQLDLLIETYKKTAERRAR